MEITAVMASAASTQGRGAARFSVNNYRFLVLLCLVFTPHSLAAKDFMRNERNTNPASFGLKHGADSLINEDQLEQVIEYLQEAVDEAHKQKDDHIRSADVVNLWDTTMKALYDQLQQLLMEPDSSPPVDELLKVSKRLVEKVRMYIDLKKKSLTAEVEDMERELEEIWEMSDSQEHFHTEL
ncbi:hypothetical protein OJAV_G00183210 [Oryzias javanicus]|uniref:Uncharacterized protein n=1 Tax=Oryzias javanicus TaxID=123683 RepID=A0A437CDE7_ORYJA|nr:hypothetical protein OJAV_G00183210 [Oryzias javanicus]